MALLPPSTDSVDFEKKMNNNPVYVKNWTWDFMNAKIPVKNTWSAHLLGYIFWFFYSIVIIIGIILLLTKHFIGFFIGKYRKIRGN